MRLLVKDLSDGAAISLFSPPSAGESKTSYPYFILTVDTPFWMGINICGSSVSKSIPLSESSFAQLVS